MEAGNVTDRSFFSGSWLSQDRVGYPKTADNTSWIKTIVRRATIGERSIIPNRGTIRRIGARIGSVTA